MKRPDQCNCDARHGIIYVDHFGRSGHEYWSRVVGVFWLSRPVGSVTLVRDSGVRYLGIPCAGSRCRSDPTEAISVTACSGAWGSRCPGPRTVARRSHRPRGPISSCSALNSPIWTALEVLPPHSRRQRRADHRNGLRTGNSIRRGPDAGVERAICPAVTACGSWSRG